MFWAQCLQYQAQRRSIHTIVDSHMIAAGQDNLDRTVGRGIPNRF